MLRGIGVKRASLGRSYCLLWAGYGRPSARPASTAAASAARVIDAEAAESSSAVCAWPFEHASFAFARLSKPGRTDVGMDEFLGAVSSMGLDFNLSRVELERVFRHLDRDGDGKVGLEDFRNGGATSPFVKALVDALTSSSCMGENLDCGAGGKAAASFPDPSFDVDVSTADFYGAPPTDGFVGENAAVRQVLDYEFHNNYIHERQLFQDALIRNNVLLKGNSTDRPWLVYTCGPMGAGKGWVLGWMSAEGILPLEHVCKVDPDTFKSRMPEWTLYRRSGKAAAAGSLTHAESSYVAEIAQNLAMENGVSVWVDGSLRNYEWHKRHFREVRRRWPHYRIAILAVDAPEATIQERLRQRGAATGRHVPKDLQRDSIRGLEKGVRTLTPEVDMVAIIENASNGFGSDSWPELKAVSMIDRSGNWDLIKSLTTFETGS